MKIKDVKMSQALKTGPGDQEEKEAFIFTVLQ